MNEQRQNKFFTVLDVFCEPNIRVSNDCYLEMLISHLSGKSKTGSNDKECRDFLKSPRILDWIGKCLDRWDTGQFPDHNIMAFTLRLLSLVIENEWQFSIVREKLILDRIQDILATKYPNPTAIIQMSNVILLNSTSQHTMGLHWIKQQRVWQVVVDYCVRNHTVYVVRESLVFINTILNRFSMLIGDTGTCEEILNQICRPIIEENPFQDISKTDIVVLVDDQDQLNKVIPSLNIVCYILEKMVQTNECHDVAKVLVDKFNLDHYLWGLAKLSHDHHFIGKIMKAHILINFTRSMLRRAQPGHDEADFNSFGVDYFNYMSFCVTRRSGANIIAMAEIYHSLWNQIMPPPPATVVMEGERIKFEDQLVILQILPILYVIKSSKESHGDCLDSYIIKLFNISCGRTIRLCYSFRDLMRTMDEEVVAELATKSIQTVLNMKNTMHRERAILVLQALVYTLQEFEPHDRSKTDYGLLLKMPNLLSAVLTGMFTLIKFYRITWKECLESTILVNFMLDLLSNPNLSTRHNVQALQLIQLSIEHFLSPSLALLVDTLQGSGMENLGPVIYRKLHDNNWEIRDSALELLASTVTISALKFPPFQKHILDSNICPIVYEMAKNDGETYVRATALNCLTHMVTISLFWENCLETLDLIPYLMDVLYTESEGVVRMEAAGLLSVMYNEKRISKSQLDTVFSIMAYCAVDDLYWEVKTNALKFWQMVICRQFQHQGVIDNTFPSVTFSKEHKKIVTLTDKEILLRLTKILNELSVRGCLGVLLHCLSDNADLEVVKVTVAIVQRLKSFLDRYHYLDEVPKSDPQGAVFDTSFNKNYIAMTQQQSDNVNGSNGQRNNADVGTNEPKNLDAGAIMDSIVDAQDVNLLVNAYENQMRVDAEGSSPKADRKIDQNYFKEFAKVSKEEFLREVTSLDMDELVHTKSEWISQIENFDSLLDDILLSLKDNVNINNADCY